MAYRLTEWTALKDQDAEICHLIEEDDEDCDAIIATFSRDELGVHRAAAVVALVNGDVADAVRAEREACAALVEPKGPCPCNCDCGGRCYCQNQGDLSALRDWMTSTAIAKTIRERA